MRRFGIAGAFAAAAAIVLVAIPVSLAIAPANPPPVNHPPVVTSSLPPDAWFPSRAPIRFTITVTDPDGDNVFARAVDAPRELSFAPIVNAPSGTTREVVIYPSPGDFHNRRGDGGPQRLVVESWDARQPRIKTQTTFRFRVIGGTSTHGLRILQTDQDAAPEFLVRSFYGDVLPVVDAGAYVLFDQPAPPAGPTLTPEQWIAHPPRQYGLTYATEQIADVNGDGIDDLIAVHKSTEVSIWFGGPGAGTHLADVTLPLDEPSGVISGGFIYPELLLADVTGDGIDDVIVACPWVDRAVTDAGVVVVFAGGSGIAHATGPTARLRVPGATAFDWLGRSTLDFEPLLVGDVTGDGVPDLVVVAPWVDVGGTIDVGAIYVWSGGAALAGAPPPTATLATTGSAKSKFLGMVDTAPATFLVDVTGDGLLDVVAGSPKTAPDGAIFVWQGGSGIAGAVAPTARLQPSPGGFGGGGLLDTVQWETQGLQFADLNLDGITDVVAARPLTTPKLGPSLAGAVYVFAGGNLSGTVTETALLQRATPKQYDHMSVKGMQLVDVTGDGAPDVVCSSHLTDANAKDDGAIEVFAARAGLSGIVTPSASLEVPGSSLDDGLTNSGAGSTGLLVEDVTGDGIRDVVGVASSAYENQVFDAGAIYVWSGGSNLLSGTAVAPTATLLSPSPFSRPTLGFRPGPGPAVRFVDWDDDGVKDLVAVDRGGYPSPKGASVTGRVFVWRGGTPLTGTPPPLAIATSHQPDDDFGGFIYSAEGLLFDDVTGDGSVDLLVTASKYDTPGGQDAGAVYVFAGGAAATGTLAPVAMLTDQLGITDDQFGEFSEFRFVDLDANGIDDVVTDVPNAQGVGRLLLFLGPIGSATKSLDSPVPELGLAPGLGR